MVEMGTPSVKACNGSLSPAVSACEGCCTDGESKDAAETTADKMGSS